MDFYEYNAEVYSDPELPVYFSINTLTGSQEDWDLHWHEATEFLYCIEGSGVAVSDAQRIPLASGNMAIINANRLHTFYTTDFAGTAISLWTRRCWIFQSCPARRSSPLSPTRRQSGRCWASSGKARNVRHFTGQKSVPGLSGFLSTFTGTIRRPVLTRSKATPASDWRW